MRAIQLNADGTKTCSKCNQDKPLDAFGKDRRTPTGLKCWCRECKSEYGKSYRARDYVKKKSISTSRQYRYGISEEKYIEMFKSQNGLCAICGQPETCLNTDGSVKNLSVDHDHSCCPGEKVSCGNCIRGLLCANCNRGIGYLKDSYDILMNATTYLMGYESRAKSLERRDDLSR